MKSRMYSYCSAISVLYWSRSAGLKPRSGNSHSSLVIAVWIRWIAVDPSGSMKPLASPIATTLPCHCWRRTPVAM